MQRYHETFKKFGLYLMNHNVQTDRQNNVVIRCVFVIGIFTKISAVYL